MVLDSQSNRLSPARGAQGISRPTRLRNSQAGETARRCTRTSRRGPGLSEANEVGVSGFRRYARRIGGAALAVIIAPLARGSRVTRLAPRWNTVVVVDDPGTATDPITSTEAARPVGPGAGRAEKIELDPAVRDLLGALAYGELSAFDRLADDARTAPSLANRSALAKMAGAEIGHYRLLEEHLAGFGVGAEDAMAPFVVALDDYHRSTAPHDWLESLVKVYLGDGLAADFYREVAGFLPEASGAVVLRVLADTGHGAFAEREVASAIEQSRQVRDRLALWGRRLLGEAITQAQHVVADRDELAEFFVRGFGDLSGIAVLFKKLQLRHGRRMATLGLG